MDRNLDRNLDRRLDRRLITLAAAYAVALNALLPALALILLPAAGSVLGPAVICAAARTGLPSDSGAPEKPGPLCPCPGACAMPGCATAVLPDTGAAIAEVAWLSVGPVELRRADESQTFRLHGRYFARGPPVV
jgi:hypothetical protein